jgi:hypothetical protein
MEGSGGDECDGDDGRGRDVSILSVFVFGHGC